SPVAAVKAEVGPLRRDLMSLEGALRVVADDQRSAMPAKQLVHLGDEPALMPKFEGVTRLRQLLERRAEAIVVALDARRELPQDRSHLRRVRERLDRLEIALRVPAHLAPPLDVRYLATPLDGEPKAARRLLHPSLDRGLGRQPVEGVVDLDRVEDGRVVIEPESRRELLG